MSKFTAFFKQNAKVKEPKQLKLDRFDEPITVAPITAAQEKAANTGALTQRPGAKGKMETKFDAGRYNVLISIAGLTHPNLKDVELQESYGVRGEEALFGEMFSAGEAHAIANEVSELSDLGKDFSAKVEEAKN